MEYLEELENNEIIFADWSKIKNDILLSLVEGQNVLEVGCGLGGLSNMLKNKGLTITATDISNECIRRAREKYPNVTFFQEDICNPTQLKLNNAFDTIVMSEVLEHIAEDKSALYNVTRLLKDGSVLVLTVPAHDFLFSDFDVKVGHQRRYNKKMLFKTLSASGYTVERCFYWNFFGIFGWYFYCKLLRRSTGQIKKGFLTHIFQVLLRLECQPRQIFPSGITLIAKARKIDQQ